MSQMPKVITSGVAVMDPNNSTNAIPNTLKVNADGSINVNADGGTGSTFTSAPVTVPSTPGGIVILAANADRKSAIIYNPGSVNVYIEQTDAVSTSSGYIPPHSAMNIDDYSGSIYGIVATGTQDVSVQEFT